METILSNSQTMRDRGAGNGGKLTPLDMAYSFNLAIACLITYWFITGLLHGRVDPASDFLGGMWAVVAVVFVFRDTREHAVSAGIARLVATCVSFALCLSYLLIFPFTPVGLAVLLGIGTLVMAALGRRGDIVTTGITTTVVMVVAAMSPHNAWQQPVLRLVDTVVGIALGVICKLIGSYLFGSKVDVGACSQRFNLLTHRSKHGS
ncbi:MAG: FUSC family protein [Acetobacteraceae bacterium]|nr:FUSC family protein [Acetobacteraceae bacterium]